MSADIGQVLEQQKGAEQNLKAACQFERESRGLSDATRELHRSQKELNRTLEENPLSPDNLAKVQRDRWVPDSSCSGLLCTFQLGPELGSRQFNKIEAHNSVLQTEIYYAHETTFHWYLFQVNH